MHYLGDVYPDYAASVFVGNDFMRSSFRLVLAFRCLRLTCIVN